MILNSYAPWTGFGNDSRTSVKFVLLHPENSFPQWSSAPKLARISIPNSNVTITQYRGREPWEVQMRLLFANFDDLDLMDSQVGRTNTLRYMWGISKRVGGVKEYLDGQAYLRLDDTLLLGLSDEVYEVDETCEATATFSRIYNGNSYVGFAEVGNDD